MFEILSVDLDSLLGLIF